VTARLFGDLSAEKQRISTVVESRLASWYPGTRNEELESGMTKSVEPDIVKVGPKGYIHGWIKVGSPEHGELDSQLTHDASTAAKQHLDRAYNASQAGDHKAAIQHLNDAHESIVYGKSSGGKTPELISRIRASLDDERAKLAAGSNFSWPSGKSADDIHDITSKPSQLRSESDQNLAEYSERLGRIMHNPAASGDKMVRAAASKKLVDDEISRRNRDGMMKITSAPLADRMNTTASAKDRKSLVSGASDAELAKADRTFSSRASALGKAGQVSKPHQMVRDEIARRAGTKPASRRARLVDSITGRSEILQAAENQRQAHNREMEERLGLPQLRHEDAVQSARLAARSQFTDDLRHNRPR
jgi:hypothetical protein